MADTRSHAKTRADVLLIALIALIVLDVAAFLCVPKRFESAHRWMLLPGGGFVGLVRYYMTDEERR